MIEILAALSAAGAAGIRTALPLLVLGILQGDQLWFNVPILSRIFPPLVIGVVITWSLIELFASKQLLGQRLLQLVQLVFSPFVGAILAIAVSSGTQVPMWLIGLMGGLFAFMLQLVQAGWFYRYGGLPAWIAFSQDALCIVLVFLSLNAPHSGGLIALILLLFAVRSIKKLRKWYLHQQSQRP